MRNALFAVCLAVCLQSALAGTGLNTTRVEDPNAPCDTCGGAAYTDIASACAAYGGWSQSCCQCIVSHESGGNYHACNKNTDGSIDAGLWQINDMNWASCNGGSAPCDVGSNRKCAQMVFQWGGNTFKYWSTCAPYCSGCC